jgi:hypothetical protein
MRLPANGVRGVDGAGISQYAPSGASTHSFDLAGTVTGSVEVGINTDTPRGIAITSDTESTEVEIARFDVKAKNLDVTVDDIRANFSGSNVSALRLYDGLTLLDEETGANTTTFADLDLAVAKDTTKTLTIKAVVSATTSVEAGSAQVTNITVTDTYDANYNQATVSGDADGYIISFYTVAPVISLTTATAQASDNNATTGAETGNYTIQFTVTAEGGDVYVSTTTSAISVSVEKSDGTTSTADSVLFTSDAAQVSGAYKVAKGTTETFTIQAVDDPGAAGYYRLVAQYFKWGTSASSPTAYTFSGALVQTLRTDYVYLTAD